jgi:putative endonuclease
MEKKFWVYMMASGFNGTIYIGVTSDLKKRVWEHKNNVSEGFTEKYDVHNLVWFEGHEAAESAIKREKQMKEWQREWKINRIRELNPEWNDLYDEICK